jgi:hypothetical protein
MSDNEMVQEQGTNEKRPEKEKKNGRINYSRTNEYSSISEKRQYIK